MIDIDFFKTINDEFGHEMGDQIIVHLTKLANNCKRVADVLARIGGEEFAMLLPETDLPSAEMLAEAAARRGGGKSTGCHIGPCSSYGEHRRGDREPRHDRNFRFDEGGRPSALSS